MLWHMVVSNTIMKKRQVKKFLLKEQYSTLYYRSRNVQNLCESALKLFWWLVLVQHPVTKT